MEYVLIFQLPGSSAKDYDELIEFEESVTERIGNIGKVDGHDIGSGERNIFVFTEEPKSVFESVKSIFERKNVMSLLKVAYREVEGCDYTTLFPPGLNRFSVTGDE